MPLQSWCAVACVCSLARGFFSHVCFCSGRCLWRGYVVAIHCIWSCCVKLMLCLGSTIGYVPWNDWTGRSCEQVSVLVLDQRGKTDSFFYFCGFFFGLIVVFHSQSCMLSFHVLPRVLPKNLHLVARPHTLIHATCSIPFHAKTLLVLHHKFLQVSYTVLHTNHNKLACRFNWTWLLSCSKWFNGAFNFPFSFAMSLFTLIFTTPERL